MTNQSSSFTQYIVTVGQVAPVIWLRAGLVVSPRCLVEDREMLKGLTGQGLEVRDKHMGCWSMLTPMLTTVVSSWLDVLWVVDHF